MTVLLMFGVFVTCKDKEPESPELELNRETIVVEGDSAAIVTFDVKSNLTWKARSDRAWINVSPEAGNGKATLTVSIAENNDGDARTGEVEVLGGGLKRRIIVSQAKTVELSISKEEIILEDYMEGATYEITVQGSLAWQIKPNVDWIKVSPMSGGIGQKVKVTVSVLPNSAEEQREGKLIITAESRTKECIVKQKKAESRFFGSSDTIFLSDKGEYRYFRFISSYQWTLTSDNWITSDKNEGNGSELLKIAANSPNSSSAERKGKITFTSGSRVKEFVVVQGFSGNYWNDGDIKEINRHTKGKGVPVVIVGDGFDRQDLKKNGWWEIWGTRIAENFLTNEIICDMKDYLDVLVLMGESQDHGINYPPYTRTRTKYDTYGAGENTDKVYLDAIAAVKRWGQTGHSDRDLDTNRIIRVIFMANGPYPGNATNPVARLGVDEQSFDYWTTHEFTGHVLSDLPDMYFAGCPYEVTPALKQSIDDEHELGFNWFIDHTDDPNQVVWKDFIGQPGYENVGIYPTTWGGLFCNNLWGPNEHTTMREWMLCFDLGSRYQIWNKILQRAGDPEGKYNKIDVFKTYDLSRTRCDCNYYKYNGKGTPYVWTKYDSKTGKKTENGDYDRFWQILWPAK